MSNLTTADEEIQLLQLIEAHSSTSSCSCSFCQPHDLCECRDDIAEYPHRDAQDVIKQTAVNQKKNQSIIYSNSQAMEVRKEGSGEGDSVKLHGFCVGLWLDVLQPLYAPVEHQKHDGDLKMFRMNVNQKKFKTRQIPSIIICKHSIDFKSLGDRSSSIRSSNMHLRILQKADDLTTMLEKGLKTRTTTETMSEYSSSCLNKSNNDINFSDSISDDSSVDVQMIMNSQECVISSSVSSLSTPSFCNTASTHSKENMYAFDHLDPLKVLSLDDEEEVGIHGSGERNTAEMNSKMASQISADQFQEYEDCREDSDNLSASRSRFYSQDVSKYSSDQRVLKEFEGSFLSYEDILPKNLTLDISDGISYDDDGTEPSNLLSMPLNIINSSTDDRADLDNVCQESIQSVRTVKSSYEAKNID